MKKILTILCCLLAPALMASSVNIVRFYQLKNDPNLSGTSAKFMKWTLGRSGGEFPVLSVFKDGVLIYEGKGYTSSVMQNLERVTLQS